MSPESASTHTFGIVAGTIVIVAGGVGVAAAILVPALNEPQPVQIGTNGPDRLSGTASGDIHLEGRGGDDTLRALGKGFDYIDAGSGDDRLVGGQGGGDYCPARATTTCWTPEPTQAPTASRGAVATTTDRPGGSWLHDRRCWSTRCWSRRSAFGRRERQPVAFLWE